MITFDWLTDRGITLVTEYNLEEEGEGSGENGERGRWGNGGGVWGGNGRWGGGGDVIQEHNKMFFKLFNTSVCTCTLCIMMQSSAVP